MRKFAAGVREFTTELIEHDDGGISLAFETNVRFNPVALLGGFVRANRDDALRTLTRVWPRLAGDFHAAGMPGGRLDLAALVLDEVQPAVLTNRGRVCRIDSAAGSRGFADNSVVVLEAMAGLGDRLAAGADPAVAAAWGDTLAQTDLHPMPMCEASEIGTLKMDDVGAEATWHAKRLGQTVPEYVAAATMLHARQTLWGYLHEGSAPTAAEWDVTTPPADILRNEAYDETVAAAAEACGSDPATFLLEALNIRNIDARRITVFERWYGADDEAQTADELRPHFPAP